MNYKIIVISIVTILVAGLITYIYIDSLNDKISDLKVELVDKDNTINSLTRNIELLNTQVESLSNTITITDDYIGEIAEIRSEEDIIKNAIYEEVLNDETDEIKNWLNERLPDRITTIINDGNKRMCKDSI